MTILLLILVDFFAQAAGARCCPELIKTPGAPIFIPLEPLLWYEYRQEAGFRPEVRFRDFCLPSKPAGFPETDIIAVAGEPSGDRTWPGGNGKTCGFSRRGPHFWVYCWDWPYW